MTIYAATGHRPDKLGGYGPRIDDRLRNLAYSFFVAAKPDEAVSGMALGWDMAFAEAALTLGIPLTAAIPFAGQESKWPTASQERYRNILARAARSVIVCDGGYSSAKMQTRNEWMVDKCDRLVALWDGSPGGTGNCIKYARQVGRDVINLWALY